MKYNSQKINSNITRINGIDLGEKPFEKPNLKPINGIRRGGGGLMAIGYEPNKNSIFNNINFGGIGLNKNRQENNNNRFIYKRELQPIIKEKKNDKIFGFNNREDNLGGFKNYNNNFGKNDKFSVFERNNPLMNQFKNDMNGISRRKRNYYSSPNDLGWAL